MTEPFVDDRRISVAALLETEAGRAKIFGERQEAANAVAKKLGRLSEKERARRATYRERGIAARKRKRLQASLDVAA